MKTKLLGAMGEAEAAAWLRKKRYTILGMNYRCRLGELDIIAREGKTLVFVEVKLRREGGYGGAAEAVTPEKQRKLRIAAEYWLVSHELDDIPCRFDVIEIYLDAAGQRITRMNQIKEAF